MALRANSLGSTGRPSSPARRICHICSNALCLGSEARMALLASPLGSNGRPPSPTRRICHSEAGLRHLDLALPSGR